MEQMATIKAWDIPSYRLAVAQKNGVEKRLCFVTHGGLGDILNSEPTVRWAQEFLWSRMGLESIHVVTRFPDMFAHLPGVQTLQADKDGNYSFDNGQEEYNFLYLGNGGRTLQDDFFVVNGLQCVDYPSIAAFRTQLPLAYRYVKTTEGQYPLQTRKRVVLHAGNTWKSKAFPKHWWDEILHGLIAAGICPVLIGGKAGHLGTVDVDPDGCIDLRGSLSIAESAALLRDAAVVISNDSFPYHLSTIGHALILFLSTAKQPDLLTHYRLTPEGRVEFGWRMENLAIGGAYERTFDGGIKAQNRISEASQQELKRWLPSPKSVVDRVLAERHSILA